MTFYNSKYVAQKYIQYRPQTPSRIIRRILDYHRLKSNCSDYALDVGCGSGQNTSKLAPYFKRVTGIDISEQQLAHAPISLSNVSFHVGNAHNLSFIKDNSVDLITTAHSLHWFPDREKFYTEARRVLKENGVLAAFAFYCPKEVNKDSQILYEWHDSELVNPGYYSEGHLDTRDHYANIQLPFQDVTRFEIGEITDWSVGHYIEFVKTVSTWQSYITHHPESVLLETLRERLREEYTHNGTEELMRLEWPYFMLLGRK